MSLGGRFPTRRRTVELCSRGLFIPGFPDTSEEHLPCARLPADQVQVPQIQATGILGHRSVVRDDRLLLQARAAVIAIEDGTALVCRVVYPWP